MREERLYNHMIKILGLGPPLIHLHQQQFITEYLNLSVLSTQYSVFLQTDRKIIKRQWMQSYLQLISILGIFSQQTGILHNPAYRCQPLQTPAQENIINKTTFCKVFQVLKIF